FALGYYPLFEYAAITRNYAPAFLLMMIACAMISRPRVRLIWISIVLLLLTQVSVLGAGLAVLMHAIAIAPSIARRDHRRPAIWSMVVWSLIVLIGAGLCFAEALPGPDPLAVDTWRDTPLVMRLLGTIGTIYRGWLPIPKWSVHFWNTNILDGMGW